jgi:hypothetical protein
MKMGNLELTNEMYERNDEITDAVYDVLLTLAEKDSEEMEEMFDHDVAELISGATDLLIEYLWDEFKIKVRHPAVVTNEDGTQYYSEYDFE